MSDLGQMIEEVRDAQSFAAFVRQLHAEIAAAKRDPEPAASENLELDPFLEALSAWAQTTTGRSAVDGVNAWQAAAKLLTAGHYYD
ncbi:MAG: hypothetical protein AAF557_14845 [Pseudomonadota bacterium]